MQINVKVLKEGKGATAVAITSFYFLCLVFIILLFFFNKFENMSNFLPLFFFTLPGKTSKVLLTTSVYTQRVFKMTRKEFHTKAGHKAATT